MCLPENSIIVFDVGNSTTAVGVADFPTLAIGSSWSVSTRPERTSAEWQSILTPLISSQREQLVGVAIASVVPRVTHSLVEMVRTWFEVEPVVVDGSSDLGLAVDVDHPLEVGADRLVNAVAARHLAGKPAIVVDAGTATKLDVVSTAGDFVGGVIAPGIGIGLEALASRTARLFTVPFTAPTRTIGRNTVAAVQSGVIVGHVAMVEGLVARVRAELAADAPVVLTGGFAQTLSTLLDLEVRLEPHLTLLGAVLVWNRVQMNAAGRSGVRLPGT